MNRHWLERLWKTIARGKQRRNKGRSSLRLNIESLEERTLLSGGSPFVQSILRTTPAAAITNAGSVIYTVTFNEPVTGVDPTDFQIVTTGTVGTTLSQVTPVNSSVYKVTVSGITGNGTLGLNLVDNNSIRDLAGDGLVQPNAPAAFQSQNTVAIGTLPRSVVVADVSGDGKPDLIEPESSYGVNAVGVLLGNGNGTFQGPRTYATGAQPYSVAVANLNGDSKPDLVVANSGSGTVSVLLGNGSGTFQGQHTFAAGVQPYAVAVADVTGDGKADVIVTDPGTGNVYVLNGNGDGTLQSPHSVISGFYFGFTVADLNGDGRPDLVFPHGFNNTVSVFLGNGNGTFQGPQVFATGVGPAAVAVADVNGDSKPDLITANEGGDTVSVLLGNGDGTFQGNTTFAAGYGPTSVAVADVTGDGKPDIVTANSTADSVSVLLGNGDGTFQSQATFATGPNPLVAAIADVSGDGRSDIVTANYAGGSISVLRNAGNGSFTGPVYTIDTIAPFVQSITLADANPRSGGTVHFTVTFSEPVTGVDPTDFKFVSTGTVGSTLTQVTPGSGAVYTVTVSGVTGNGSLGLNLVDNGSTRDLAGNPLTQQNTGTAFKAQQTFAAGGDFGPNALALGDVNNDGKPDLVTGGGTVTAGVFLGNGDGTFQAQQLVTTNFDPSPVALADVNGDGKADLIVVIQRTNQVGVLLGNGDGTFQAEQDFTTGSLPYSVAVADVNGDGKPDLVVANYNNIVSVLLGKGDGTFQAQATFATGSHSRSVAVADVNGDGKPDLVVANTTGTNVGVLLGNGNGTFQAQATFATGSGPDTVAVADLNGDGKPDLFVASSGSNIVSVLLGNGNGTFQARETFGSGPSPFSAAIGDVNGDGKPDLVVSNLGGPGKPGNVGVLLGNGDGTFQAQQIFATNPYPHTVVLGDLNGDGRPDIALAIPYSPSIGFLSLFFNSANGNFAGPVYTIDTVAPIVQSITLADPNPTSASTVHFTVTFSEAVTGVDPTDFKLALSGTTGTISTVTPVSGAVYTVTVSGASGSGTLGLNLVDDGSIRDLAGNPLASQNKTAHFSNQTAFATGSVPISVALADLNHDGQADLVVANYFGATVGVLLGNGNGTFQAQQSYATGTYPRSVAVGDVNGDGKPDLIVANLSSYTVSVLLGNGDGTFQAQQTFATGNAPHSVAVADVNGDGKPDLVVANYYGVSVGVLLGNGNGTFQAQQSFATGTLPASVVVADFNGDGKPDLVTANYTDNTLSVLLGNGDGTFQAQQTFPTGYGPFSVAVSDFNGDGKPDLVSANYTDNTLSVLLGNGNGTFQAQQSFVTGNAPYSVAVGDVNGDGNPDLVVTNFQDKTAGVLLGNGDGTFQAQQTFATGGEPSSVAVGDVNGDGRLDFVVANALINSASLLLNSANGTLTGPVYTLGSSSPATHFVVSGTPGSIAAGTGFTFTVTAEDQSNSTASGYSGTVAFTSSDSAATLPANSTLVNGVGIFSATLTTLGSRTLTATDVTISSITGASNSILVTPASATHFVYTGIPSGTTAGTRIVFTVTAEDVFNNVATGYSGSVAMSASDTAAVFTPVSKTFTSGAGTFSVTLRTSGIQTITATDTSNSSLTGSSTITVSSAAVTHLVLGTVPSSVTAGAGFNLTVTAEDTFGNPATGYTGTIAVTSTDTAASIVPASSTLSGGVGVFSVTLKTVGAPTVTAKDTVAGNLTATTGTIGVGAAAASHFAFIGVPTGTTAGHGFGFTVTALDPFNNSASGYSGTVTLSSSDGAAIFVPASGALPGGRGTFSVTLKTAGNQRLTATDSATGSVTGTSNAITVSAADAAHFAISGAPPSIAAGTAFKFTVTAQDAFNNTDPTYIGTVKFSSTDGAATLPANSTLTGGVGTFSATLATAGSQTLTAADTVTSSVSGSAAVTVTAQVTSHFQVIAPANVRAGQFIVYTVIAEDRFNNVVTTYSGVVKFTSSDTQAQLSSPSPLSNGSGTFAGELLSAGLQTIIATDTAVSTLTGGSNSITVTAANVSRLAISAAASASVGTGFSVTVTAQDQFGNTVPSYAGTVHITASDTAAVLPPSAPLTAGVGHFSVTLLTAGNQTVTATDTVSSGLTGSAAIHVNAGNATHFVVTIPATATAGNGFAFQVTAEDQFNDIAAGYTGTVHFSSGDTQAGLPANTTLSGGTGNFVAVLKTAGNQTITAADVSASSISGASNTVLVSATSTARFAIVPVLPVYPGITTGPNSFASTGLPTTFTALAVDQFGNTTPTYSGTVQFTSSDTAAGVVLPTSTVLASGAGTFSATLATAGNQTLTATDAVNNVTGTSNPIITRGLVVTNLTPTASGFTVTFNKPFTTSSVNLYSVAAGAQFPALPDDVILATTSTQVSVRGSLVFTPPTNVGGSPTGFTFVKTASVSSLGVFNPGSGLLTAGNYTLTLRSFGAQGSGFQDALGAPLDGKNTGTASGNYQITFAVAAPPVAVGIPDFARGPSNTDALFLPSTLTNGSTFALSYTNPAANPPTATATITFSTNAATLASNIQTALSLTPNSGGGLANQIGLNTSANSTPNSVVIVTNDTSTGANVLVTFQSALAQSTNQLLGSTTPGVSISLAPINVANNLPGFGIPIALTSGLGVTSGSFTLQYNPALLTISAAVSKVAGASFTVVSNNTVTGTLVLSLSSPASISSTTSAIIMGSLLATVPLAATATYGAKQLLHFSSEQLGGTAGTIPVTNQDGVEVAAYFGDVTDTGGPLVLQDAAAIATVASTVPNTAAQTIPGFNAFPNIDPIIIGDVSLQGAVNSTDAGAITQQLGGTARITIPYAPIGLPVTPVGPGAAPTVSGGQAAPKPAIQHSLAASNDTLPIPSGLPLSAMTQVFAYLDQTAGPDLSPAGKGLGASANWSAPPDWAVEDELAFLGAAARQGLLNATAAGGDSPTDAHCDSGGHPGTMDL